MTHFILAGLDHVEDAKCRLVLVCRVDPNFQFAIGHRFDHVGHVDDRVAKDRESRHPGLGQFPDNHFFLDLALRRRCCLLLFPTSRQSQDRDERHNPGAQFQSIFLLFHRFFSFQIEGEQILALSGTERGRAMLAAATTFGLV